MERTNRSVFGTIFFLLAGKNFVSSGAGMGMLVKASDPVTLILSSGVQFPAVTMRRSPREASCPTVPLCVVVKKSTEFGI